MKQQLSTQQPKGLCLQDESILPRQSIPQSFRSEEWERKLSILPGHHWLLQEVRLNFRKVAEALVKVNSLWGRKRRNLALLWRNLWMLQLTAYNGSKTALNSNSERKLKTIQQAVPCATVTAWASTEWKIPLGLQSFLSDAERGESLLPSAPCQQPSPWDCFPCRDLERDAPSASGVEIPPGWQVLLYWCLMTQKHFCPFSDRHSTKVWIPLLLMGPMAKSIFNF